MSRFLNSGSWLVFAVSSGTGRESVTETAIVASVVVGIWETRGAVGVSSVVGMESSGSSGSAVGVAIGIGESVGVGAADGRLGVLVFAA
ncbi:hypothetical protein BT69DRAFT_1290750 [Atractiella rhizophila]|nr:hypothetical protein BT69DRAFT_1290750 [Atractiella rhizophila]